jgi:hypothetical protein
MRIGTLISPWYRRAAAQPGGAGVESGSTAATAILDLRSAPIERLVQRARRDADSADQRAVLRTAHAIIRDEVRPVYALEERTPASTVLRRGSGSCSQRLAILECVARSIGVPTRTRALWIDRAFWYPRFPSVRWALPDRILLAWPEFDLDGWRQASELFGSLGCRGGGAFTNRGAETLFEAAGRCAVDWDGRTGDPAYDLSHHVIADLGYFTHRDEAFAQLRQTLCAPARLIADPILRRVAA